MYKTRKIGFGLATMFGLMLTVPVMAAQGTDPFASAQTHIREAMGTLAQLKQLDADIKARKAQAGSSAVANDSTAPLKCPACGMMMPTKPTGNLTRAVKYSGKTYYCCKGCDMSATADKE
jgi:hypothetical protein